MKNIEKVTAKVVLATRDENGVESYNSARNIQSFLGLGDYIFSNAEQAEAFRTAVEQDMNEWNYLKASDAVSNATEKVRNLKEQGADKSKIVSAENAKKKAELALAIYSKLPRKSTDNIFARCISAYLNGSPMPTEVYHTAGIAVARCKNPSAKTEDIRKAFQDMALALRLDGSDGLTKKMVCKINKTYLQAFVSACCAGFPRWNDKHMDIVGMDEMPLVRMAIFYFIVTMSDK